MCKIFSFIKEKKKRKYKNRELISSLDRLVRTEKSHPVLSNGNQEENSVICP